MITISRKAHFNAAHKLYRPDWTDEKNNEIFGKCSNQNFHGHNYELIVSLTGKVDPETGYVYDMGKLKNIIKSEIEDYLDHKNLNLDVVGLMCIPPADDKSEIFFKEMAILTKKLDLKELSMGMSADYIEAAKNSSTYIRIGSSIFGKRS